MQEGAKGNGNGRAVKSEVRAEVVNSPISTLPPLASLPLGPNLVSLAFSFRYSTSTFIIYHVYHRKVAQGQGRRGEEGRRAQEGCSLSPDLRGHDHCTSFRCHLPALADSLAHPSTNSHSFSCSTSHTIALRAGSTPPPAKQQAIEKVGDKDGASRPIIKKYVARLRRNALLQGGTRSARPTRLEMPVVCGALALDLGLKGGYWLDGLHLRINRKDPC